MQKYSINIEFSTDRPMTDDEIASMETAVYVQVSEPSGLDGDKRAGFNTRTVEITVNEL
jgi:hypothetical protein